MKTAAVFFLLYGLFLLPGFLYSQDWEEGKQIIEWEPVKGAAYYRILVRQKENIIVDRTIEKTTAPLFLNPGDYTYKVTVFNKFEKIVSESEWRTLTVVPAVQPVLRSVEPSLINANNKGQLTLILEVLNLTPDGKIFAHANGTVFDCTWKTKGENLYEIDLDDPIFGKPGTVGIEVVNPSGKSDKLENAVTVRNLVPPHLKRLSVNAGHVGDVFIDIHLEGTGFEKGALLEFSGPETKTIYDARTDSGKLILFNLKLDNLPPGKYNLIIKNPSGLDDIMEDAFTVYDRIEEIPENVVLNEKGKEKRPWGSKISGIGIGYHGSVLWGSLNSLYDYSFVGAEIRARMSFKNDFFIKAPFLKQVGLDFGVNYTMYTSHDDYGDYVMHVVSSDICLLYKTPFPIFINFVFKGGMGGCLTMVKGSGLLVDMDSATFDFQTLASGGLELSIAQRMYIELGTRFRWHFLISGINTHMEPYIVMGLFFH